MKLTKEDLEHAIWCASDPLYPNDLFNRAGDALKEGTLEIEGYVKYRKLELRKTMKLSKEELIDLLYGVGTDWGPSEYVYHAERVIDALKTNTLEIEGYVREGHFRDVTKMVHGWHKFDPKDKSTFPDNLTPVLICYKNGKVREEFHWAKDEFGVNIDPTTITHWHPLPPPPGKEEAQ